MDRDREWIGTVEKLQSFSFSREEWLVSIPVLASVSFASEQLREPGTLSVLQQTRAKYGSEWMKRTQFDESQRETGLIAQDMWYDAS